MTEIYSLDCTPLLDVETLRCALPYLGSDRRAKAMRLRNPQKRAQSVAAGLLLGHFFGIDAAYIYGQNGKPYLSNSKRYFSLSHTQNLVVLAISDTEIGVDAQTIAPLRPVVLRRCFTPREQEIIGADSTQFAKLWTIKEAYLKMIGAGLSIPAREVDTTTLDVPFYCTQLDDCMLAVCGEASATIVEMKLKDLL